MGSVYVNRYGNISASINNHCWNFSPEESLQLFNELKPWYDQPTISAELDYLKEFVVSVVRTEVFYDGSINYMVRPNASSDNYIEDFGLSKEATKYIESVVRDNLIKKIESNARENN